METTPSEQNIADQKVDEFVDRSRSQDLSIPDSELATTDFVDRVITRNMDKLLTADLTTEVGRQVLAEIMYEVEQRGYQIGTEDGPAEQE